MNVQLLLADNGKVLWPAYDLVDTVTGGMGSTVMSDLFETVTGGMGSTVMSDLFETVTGGMGSTVIGDLFETVTGGMGSTVMGDLFEDMGGGMGSTVMSGLVNDMSGGVGRDCRQTWLSSDATLVAPEEPVELKSWRQVWRELSLSEQLLALWAAWLLLHLIAYTAEAALSSNASL